jgi:hypothetical protein
MTNKVYAELIKFDNEHIGMGIHDKLKLYVISHKTYGLNYYIAKLSHEIYKTRGSKGHNGRTNIRRHLKQYANNILKCH